MEWALIARASEHLYSVHIMNPSDCIPVLIYFVPLCFGAVGDHWSHVSSTRPSFASRHSYLELPTCVSSLFDRIFFANEFVNPIAFFSFTRVEPFVLVMWRFRTVSTRNNGHMLYCPRVFNMASQVLIPYGIPT